MKLRRATDPYDWPALLALIQAEFAYMQRRIDPPSSMHRLTGANIAAMSVSGEVWVIEAMDRPVACIFLTPQPAVLYLGKLAVAADLRGRSLARRLVEHAAARAAALNLPLLELETRIELVENHAAFAAMGFAKTAETAHTGHTRPTAITMQRKVDLT